MEIIREKLKTTQDCQKSYADKYRRDLEFEVGDKVFLKLSPWKGVLQFGGKGKSSPRFIGPYEILKRSGHVAYLLALPMELSKIHDVFHGSMLHTYVPNPSACSPHLNLSPSSFQHRRPPPPVFFFSFADQQAPPPPISIFLLLLRFSRPPLLTMCPSCVSRSAVVRCLSLRLDGTVSYGITTCYASFGITRLQCVSDRITRLICMSFGITRLTDVCVLRDHETVMCNVKIMFEADRRGARRMRKGHMGVSCFIASAQSQPVPLKEKLSYEEEPMQILDKKEQVLRNKVIPLVKVLKGMKNGENQLAPSHSKSLPPLLQSLASSRRCIASRRYTTPAAERRPPTPRTALNHGI
ncbi:Retrotransposon protein, Ty3-gypsy subclass [Cucumis melo var. makuwa]|uniref:Retrotransposon protein, Ty3-gypsy subclass n=1 Tax=Cucumis melo var. makuwa TaxID=1194695 RepID=A0A5D3BZL0_CUCMM|nr:Retrotransposon protein, Ty3-gypsy subclass [Cucumis melo var. makuwa]TYK05173.1 Retrotransposon protein, Ty3-gypsy subclass [Cucumis melo var. makuwa]